jgi:hypothetical protein
MWWDQINCFRKSCFWKRFHGLKITTAANIIFVPAFTVYLSYRPTVDHLNCQSPCKDRFADILPPRLLESSAESIEMVPVWSSTATWSTGISLFYYLFCWLSLFSSDLMLIGSQEWNDVNLRWNSSEYGGVKDLRIPPHRIWKPDVLMYNR